MTPDEIYTLVLAAEEKLAREALDFRLTCLCHVPDVRAMVQSAQQWVTQPLGTNAGLTLHGAFESIDIVPVSGAVYGRLLHDQPRIIYTDRQSVGAYEALSRDLRIAQVLYGQMSPLPQVVHMHLHPTDPASGELGDVDRIATYGSAGSQTWEVRVHRDEAVPFQLRLLLDYTRFASSPMLVEVVKSIDQNPLLDIMRDRKKDGRWRDE